MKFFAPILFSLLFVFGNIASAEENCPNLVSSPLPTTAQPSVADMAEAACKNAVDKAAQPDAENILMKCIYGVDEGRKTWRDGLYDSAAAVGSGLKGVAEWVAGKVAQAWNGSDDAALAAERAAEENAAGDATWLQSLSEYYEAAKLTVSAFLQETGGTFEFVGRTMWCAPWSERIHSVCMAIENGLLEFGTLSGVAKAGNKTAAALAAAKDFVARTNKIEGLSNLSLTQRLNSAVKALEEQNAYRSVERFGKDGNLKSRIDPITNQETLHFEEINSATGKTVMRDLPRDAKTLAIDANFETGKRVAKLTVEKSKDDFLLFADVNNLGKVNYFKKGTQAGDEYLQRVGENIRKNLRPEDRFFKNGGDELVVVLKTKDPAEAKKVIERIHQSIASDTELQALFRSERAAKAAEIKAAANGAKPSNEQIAALQETAKIRPSLSIGSTRIQGEWSSDLARAEKQAGAVKARYKQEIGLETSKYGNVQDALDTTTGAKPNLKARPPVLDPIE